MKRQPIYLDYAAATPVADEVLAAMQPYYSDKFYNPSATYLASQQVKQDLGQARAKVASVLGAKPSEVVFTAGGSEANNLAIDGVMRGNPSANMIVSAIEHDSVLETAEQYDVRICPVNETGLVDLAALNQLIDDNTALVSIMYANNEIGTVQPIKRIAEIVAEKRAARTSKLPLLLHTDAAQAANYLDLHVNRLGADLMTLNGGKIYAPKQSGALYVRAGVVLEPLVRGGGQERGLRSGTENVAASVGFAVALEMAQKLRKDEVARLRQLQTNCITGLENLDRGIVVNGSQKHRLPNNVHITIPGSDNERLIMELDEAGIMAAAGSACSASSELPSHVLMALGLSDETAQSSLRFSFGRDTDQVAIDRLLAELRRLLA
jgi:cysteine desulfurase